LVLENIRQWIVIKPYAWEVYVCWPLLKSAALRDSGCIDRNSLKPIIDALNGC